jgi:hypothetical protein
MTEKINFIEVECFITLSFAHPKEWYAKKQVLGQFKQLALKTINNSYDNIRLVSYDSRTHTHVYQIRFTKIEEVTL